MTSGDVVVPDEWVQAAAEAIWGNGRRPYDWREVLTTGLAAVIPAIRRDALSEVCSCESAFCDEFCQACEVFFDLNISIDAADKKRGMTATELQAALSLASPKATARVKVTSTWRGYLTGMSR